MDTIYLKIKIKKSDYETNLLREEGLFFEKIAEAINIDRKSIIEIDETNYNNVKFEFKRKFSKTGTKKIK